MNKLQVLKFPRISHGIGARVRHARRLRSVSINPQSTRSSSALWNVAQALRIIREKSIFDDCPMLIDIFKLVTAVQSPSESWII